MINYIKEPSSTIEEYISNCERFIKSHEGNENYEECALLLKEINAIKSNDIKTYVALRFDAKGLKKSGFITSTNYEEVAEKICFLFGYKSVFEYSIQPDGIRAHLSYGKPYGENPTPPIIHLP